MVFNTLSTALVLISAFSVRVSSAHKDGYAYDEGIAVAGTGYVGAYGSKCGNDKAYDAGYVAPVYAAPLAVQAVAPLADDSYVGNYGKCNKCGGYINDGYVDTFGTYGAYGRGKRCCSCKNRGTVGFVEGYAPELIASSPVYESYAEAPIQQEVATPAQKIEAAPVQEQSQQIETTPEPVEPAPAAPAQEPAQIEEAPAQVGEQQHIEEEPTQVEEAPSQVEEEIPEPSQTEESPTQVEETQEVEEEVPEPAPVEASPAQVEEAMPEASQEVYQEVKEEETGKKCYLNGKLCPCNLVLAYGLGSNASQSNVIQIVG